jgi:hypothetical protein
MECTFCNKHFSTKGSLTTHQKTAKYCLGLQSKDNEEYKCNYCHKSFTLQHVLNDHHKTCKDKQTHEIINVYQQKIDEKEALIEAMRQEYQQKIKEKDALIDSYQQKLEERESVIEKYEAKLEKFENVVIATALDSRPTTITYNNNSNNSNNTNTTNTTNTLNLSKEYIEPILRSKLTFNDAIKGQKGLANVVFNSLLKGDDGQLLYKCKDSSRQNFEYTDEQGDVKKDVHAKKLIQALIDSKVEKIAGDVGEEAWENDTEKFDAFNEKVSEIVRFGRDSSAFRSELTALTS